MTFIVTAFLYSEQFKYRMDINAFHYNDILKQMLKAETQLNYDDEYNEFMFYFSDGLIKNVIIIDENETKKILTAIDKYEDWNKKAIKKAVTLEKNIAKIELGVNSWRIGNTEWVKSDAITLSITFLSQNKNRHQLLFSFSKAQAMANDYLTNRPCSLYFDTKDIEKLKESLSSEAVKKFLIKMKKQKKIEEEFK